MIAEAPATTSGLVVGRLVGQNYRKLRVIDLRINGRHAKFFGPNAAGKTTVLDLVYWILGGKGTKDIPEPIQYGADKAYGRLELVDRQTGELKYVVERSRTAAGSVKLELSEAAGSKIKRPQEFIDAWLDDYTLDPTRFLGLREQDMIDEILKNRGVKPPIEEVKAIAGELIEAREGESAAGYLQRISADDTSIFYDRRRTAHRQLVQKQKALEEQRAVVDRLGATEPSQSVAELLVARESLHKKREQRTAVATEATLARNKHQEAVRLLETRRSERRTLEAEIEDLKRQLAAKEQKLAEVSANVTKGEGIVAGLDATAKEKEKAVADYPDPSTAIAELDRQITETEANQKERAKRELARAELERLSTETQQADEEHKRLDAVLARLREFRKNFLNGLDLGVNGLKIMDGALRLFDAPFQQGSLGQRVGAICAISFQRRPELRILRMDEAECMDENTMREVVRCASAAGFECLMAIVQTRNPKTGEEIKDLRWEFEEVSLEEAAA